MISLREFNLINKKIKEKTYVRVCVCGTDFFPESFLQTFCSDCNKLMSLDRRLYKKKLENKIRENLTGSELSHE